MSACPISPVVVHKGLVYAIDKENHFVTVYKTTESLWRDLEKT